MYSTFIQRVAGQLICIFMHPNLRNRYYAFQFYDIVDLYNNTSIYFTLSVTRIIVYNVLSFL